MCRCQARRKDSLRICSHAGSAGWYGLYAAHCRLWSEEGSSGCHPAILPSVREGSPYGSRQRLVVRQREVHDVFKVSISELAVGVGQAQITVQDVERVGHACLQVRTHGGIVAGHAAESPLSGVAPHLVRAVVERPVYFMPDFPCRKFRGMVGDDGQVAEAVVEPAA